MLTEMLTLQGTVIEGARLGGKLGFPTANIDASEFEVDNGVYLVRIELEGEVHDGIANLGRRPTIGTSERLLEVHLFDFDRELYGSRLKVRLTTRLRGEMKFESVEAMARQVKLDIEKARTMLR